MAKRLTYEKLIEERNLVQQYFKCTNLFDLDNLIPRHESELIRALDEKNKIAGFCQIIFDLQNTTRGRCLDKYKFYMEYSKKPLRKNSVFTINDALKMFEICEEYKRATLFVLGILLYRDYEPDSIFSLIAENVVIDNRQEAIEALAQAKYLESYEDKLIRQDKAQEKINREKKPLTDKTIRNNLTYSQFSRYPLKYNFNYFTEQQANTFWHFLCVLQVKRKDLDIFNKKNFEPFIKACIDNRNTQTIKNAHDGYLKMCTNEYNKAQLNELLRKPDYYKEQYGELDYNYALQYYSELVNNQESNEEPENILEESIIEDIEDFWPNEQECKTLQQMYCYKENALVNSIASLLHVIKEQGRILAYYLIPEKRIKLADPPILDGISGDEYIIQPQLKRPIDSIIHHLTHFANRYNDEKHKNQYDEADKIVFRWLTPEYNNSAKLNCFIHLVLNLQMNGLEIIEQATFSKIFDKQIQQFKANKPLLPDNDDFFLAMEHFNSDKDCLLREIAILIEEGYKYHEIEDYYKSTYKLNSQKPNFN
ncbi:MAG: hypothetical protein HDQ88_03980 [Clostridia bacterium]|nr:hypothetical protein [Clostridia bacterium]